MLIKKLITSLAVTLGTINLSFAASDELVNLPSNLICLTEKQLESTLTEYDEVPSMTMISNRIVAGKEIVSSTVLFINYQTRSWTLVEKVAKDMYCISGLGANIEPFKE